MQLVVRGGGFGRAPHTLSITMFWEGVRKDNRISDGFSRIKATEAPPPHFCLCLGCWGFFIAVEKSQTNPTTHQIDPNRGREHKDLGTEQILTYMVVSPKGSRAHLAPPLGETSREKRT